MRLKHDIELISNQFNPYKSIGINYYKWKYNDIVSTFDNKYVLNQTYFGVMAQELLSIYPDAVNKECNGYYAVNYSLLNEYTKE